MMYQRDYMHRKAVDTQCDDMWQKYRELRNKINNTTKFENSIIIMKMPLSVTSEIQNQCGRR